ncbi:MAG: MBL fold metallo-hydrolase [Chloroflexi bacterium]|nr:MBL fold metallo-hydrolase [Chloroflexota bacterium]
MILETLVVGPFMSNCYVVGSEATGKGMAIDPGADAQHILSAIKRYSLSVQTVVITHAHPDHMAAARAVVDATGAKLAIHELDGRGPVYQAVYRMFGPFVGGPMGAPPAPDQLLQDGDKIEVGGLSFTVLHTPGHSPGGISLYGEGVAFTGDTLFNSSVGRYDLPGCSFDDLARSIRTKLYTLPDATIVYPGHGPATTIGAEKASNPFVRV